MHRAARKLPASLTIALGLCVVVMVATAVALVGSSTDPAVNDRLELATDLTFVELPTTDRIDGRLATTEVGDPTAVLSPKATLWWRWAARVDAQMVVNTANTSVDAALSIYEYDEGGVPELLPVLTTHGPAGTGASLSFAATDGSDYVFMVDQQSAAGVLGRGDVELTLAFDAGAPSNDDVTNASPITGFPFSESSNTASATTETNEVDHAGEPAARSTWWTWTAPSSQTITLDTCGSHFDTTLAVYTGTAADSVTTVVSNDDGDLLCDNDVLGLSSVEFTAVAGVEYLIAVDGFVGAAGPLTINATSSAATPDGLVILDDPCVVYDSQAATATGLAGAMNGLDVRSVQVQGTLTNQGGAASCIPNPASSAIFRISSIDPLTEGNLRMTPAGLAATGGAGVVNYGAANGLDNANTVTVPLSGSGAVDIEANAGVLGTVPTTDVRLVVLGYYSSAVSPDLGFFSINPCVAADSRPNKGADGSFDGPNDDGLWPVGSAFPDVDVVGTFSGGQGGNGTVATIDCGVPASADAVMVNVVAVNVPNGSPSGFLSVGAGGSNPVVEATTPFADLNPKMNNGATTVVNLPAAGTLSIDIDGAAGAETNVRVEVLGYFDTGGGLGYSPVTPCAFFDTRTNNGRLAAGVFADKRKHGVSHTTTYKVTGSSITVDQGGIVPSAQDPTVGSCGVPDGASAVLVNLEAVNAVQEGNFWVAAASAAPGAATTGGVLNFNNVTPKMNNANAVVVPVNANGEMELEINAGSFTADGTEITEARGIVLGYYN